MLRAPQKLALVQSPRFVNKGPRFFAVYSSAPVDAASGNAKSNTMPDNIPGRSIASMGSICLRNCRKFDWRADSSPMLLSPRLGRGTEQRPRRYRGYWRTFAPSRHPRCSFSTRRDNGRARETKHKPLRLYNLEKLWDRRHFFSVRFFVFRTRGFSAREKIERKKGGRYG